MLSKYFLFKEITGYLLEGQVPYFVYLHVVITPHFLIKKGT